MLAIAGAKGGCGKTTVTLGVAEAFARRGTPTLVVDADRQQPTVHAVAGVDREPTLADLRGSTGVDRVAHAHPEVDDVGVVTAPTESQLVDVEAALDRARDAPVRTLVDCPPGAGPDAVEPIAAADAVLVVTDGTEQSVAAAETTMRMARRLDTDVLGVVANRCDAVPDDRLAGADVPLFGPVPRRDEPLSAPDARAAFDDLATELVRSHHDQSALDVAASDRLSTGIGPLDVAFQGGLPPGSVVALTADPNSQSELLLHELAATRGTLYLSTSRSEAVVRSSLDASNAAVGNVTVRRLDDERPFEHARTLIEEIPPKANLVVDPANDLERRDQSAYDEFLNALVERMRESSGLAVLHCLEESPEPKNRPQTEHFADVVLEFESGVSEGAMTQRLTVPKSRRSRAPEAPVEIDLTEDLAVSGPSADPGR